MGSCGNLSHEVVEKRVVSCGNLPREVVEKRVVSCGNLPREVVEKEWCDAETCCMRLWTKSGVMRKLAASGCGQTVV